MKTVFATLVSTALIVFGTFSNVRANVVANSSLKQRDPRIRFVPRLISESNRKMRYTIKARYPQATGPKGARTSQLNQAIRTLIMEEVGGFRKGFEGAETPDGPGSTPGSSFASTYTVKLAARDLVSIYFAIDTYGEGAAHGNLNSLVFNYDLASGRQLRLVELFRPNANYLAVISNYAIRELKKQLGPDTDTDWIERGAAASEENYMAWALTRQGLEITFDPYQVASYAEGPHKVVVPYSVLRNVLDRNGPLARIVSERWVIRTPQNRAIEDGDSPFTFNALSPARAGLTSGICSLPSTPLRVVLGFMLSPAFAG